MISRWSVCIALVSCASITTIAAGARIPDSAPGLDARPVAIVPGAGVWTCVHLVQSLSDGTLQSRLQQIDRDAPKLAGVHHVVLVHAETAKVKSWADTVSTPSLAFIPDPDGSIAVAVVGADAAGQLGSAPASVVIAEHGERILTIDGDSTVAALASRLTPLTRVKLAEYNLPKGSHEAVNGYDVVAYFEQHKAVKGSGDLQSEYRGVTYRFSTAANRLAFAQNPAAYLPTYGGWCATAMGESGAKVEIDPTNFKVEHGRLFLFYKGFLGNAQNDWNKHAAEFEPAADKHWKDFSGEQPPAPAQATTARSPAP